MKKMLKWMLLLALVLAALCCAAAAEGAEIIASGVCGAKGSDVNWTLDAEGTLTITGMGSMTSDGEWENTYADSIRRLVVSEGVEELYFLPFANLTSLGSVELPSSLRTVGYQAFAGCTELREIVIPQGVTTLESGVFYRCEKLEKVTLPEGLTSVGKYLFQECPSIQEVNIPASLTEIDDGLFLQCSGLERYCWPAHVAKIGNHAFQYCSALREIDIPVGVTEIGICAFQGCESLESVVLPEGLTLIGNWAFKDCAGLSEINIPRSVTELGALAFNGCSSLKSITLPRTISLIDVNAFGNCAEGFTAYVYEDSYAHSYCVENSVPYELIKECNHVSTGENVATCAKYAVCDLCGAELADQGYAPHMNIYVNIGDSSFHRIDCFACGAMRIGMEEHVFVSFDDDNAAGCIMCGAANDAFCTDGHDWTIVPGYAADCTQKLDGMTDGIYCSVCRTWDGRQESISWEDGHEWQREVVIPADCHLDGTLKQTCTLCGAVELEVIDHSTNPLAHAALAFEKVIQEAGCTQEGIESWKCADCGFTTTISTAARGHVIVTMVVDYDENGELTDTLNCEGGVYSYTGCRVCGKQLSEPTLIPDSVQAAHQGGAAVKLEASCTTAACWRYECQNEYCEYEWYQNEDGLMIDPVLGQYHDVSAGVIELVLQEASCTEDGLIRYVCPACNAQIAPDKSGNYVDSTKSFVQKALGHTNDLSQTENASHISHAVAGWRYTEATCAKPGCWESYCAACGGNYLKVTDESCGIGSHAYIRGRAVTGEVCGELAGYEQVCKYCGETRLGEDGLPQLVEAFVEHDYAVDGEPIVQNSCSKDGYGRLVCARCGDSTYGVIAKTDDCDFQYVFMAAACTEPARRGWFCVKCGMLMPETTFEVQDGEPVGHRWDNGTTVSFCGFDNVVRYACHICLEEKFCDADGKTVDISSGAHTAGSLVMIKKTCLNDGLSKLYACTRCGYELPLPAGASRYEVIPAGHVQPVDGSETFTDCTGTYRKYSCAVCGEGIEEKISDEADAKRHRSIGYDYITPGSCTEDGLGYLMCSGCGWRSAEAETIPASHTWGKEPETVEAGCITPGGTALVCTACGDCFFISETEPALGHDLVVQMTNASCTEDGEMTEKCVRCGEIISSILFPATGHKLAEDTEDERHVQATCQAGGVAVYKCMNKCGYEELLETEPDSKAHNWSTILEYEKPDCATGTAGLAMQECTICEFTGVNAIPAEHSWDEGKVLVAATCAEEGVLLKTCINCGSTTNEATKRLPHSYVESQQAADCEHAEGIVTKCSVCGFIASFIKTGEDAYGHNWGETVFVAATCTRSGGHETACLREGCDTVLFEEDETLPALNHKGKTLVEERPASCVSGYCQIYLCPLCGEEITVQTGKPDLNAHDWEITKQYSANLSCDEPGYVDRVCRYCGRTQVMVWHVPDCTPGKEMIVITAPGCGTEGVGAYSCTVCGRQMKVAIPATGEGHQAVQAYVDYDENGKLTDQLDCCGGVYSCLKCAACGQLLTEPVLVEDSVQASHSLSRGERVYASCTHPAGYIYRCQNAYCQYSHLEDDNGNIVAVQPYHDVSAGVIQNILIETSCTQEGLMEYLCPTCGGRIAPDGKGNYVDGGNEAIVIPKWDHLNDVSQLEEVNHNVWDGHNVIYWTYTAPFNGALGYWESTCGMCGGNYLKVIDEVCVSEFLYTVEDGRVTITGYTGAASDLVIPGEINGLPVVAIARGVCYSSKQFTSITLPASLESIAQKSLSGNYNQTAYIVEEGSRHFKTLDGVLYSIDGKRLLLYPAGKAQTNYSVPVGVEAIGQYTFSCCENLVHVQLPEGCKRIEPFAFGDCSALESILLPRSISAIDRNAFAGSKALTARVYRGSYAHEWCMIYGQKYELITETIASGECGAEGDNLLWTLNSLGELTITGSGAMADYTAGNPAPWQDWMDMIETVGLPDGAVTIGSHAFDGCGGLSTIALPDALESIGSNAFAGCGIRTAAADSLDHWLEIGFADRLSNPLGATGGRLLLGGSELTEIRLPAHCTEIKPAAFCGLSRLSSVVLHDGVRSIGESAFENCTALADFSMQDGVNFIGENAFRGCGSLRTITLPESIGSFGGAHIFADCPLLTARVHENSPAHDYCEANDVPYNLIAEFEYRIVDGSYVVITGYDGNEKNIFIPETIENLPVREIEGGAFRGKTFIESVQLPQNLEKIGASAFEGCNQIIDMFIPANVEQIGQCAFRGCTSIEGFVVDEGNAYFSIISGAILSSDLSELHFVPNGLNKNHYKVPNEVEKIHDHAFDGNSYIQKITLNAATAELGDYAFVGCPNLMNLHVNNKNPYFKAHANILYDADGSTLLFFPPKSPGRNLLDFTTIAKNAFNGCCLDSIILPASVEHIEGYAFSNCGFYSIELNEGLKTIDDRAFVNCGNMERITIPRSVTEVREAAFSESGIGTVYCYPGSVAVDFATVIEVASGAPDGECQFHLWMLEMGYPASCTEDGLTDREYCLNCGFSTGGVRIPAAHTLVKESLTPPVCNQPGEESWVCTVCGEVEKRVILPTSNAHEFLIENWIVPMNCGKNETGLIMRVCIHCAEGKLETVPVTHEWTTVKELATPNCVMEGKAEQRCAVCKATQVVVLPRTGHSIVETHIEASCTAGEAIVRKCIYCDLLTEVVGEELSPALGHAWSEAYVVEAGCEKAGGMMQSCTREGCDETIFKEDAQLYPPLAHVRGELVETIPASCIQPLTEVYSCTNCDSLVYMTIGTVSDVHDWRVPESFSDSVSCGSPGYVDRYCDICDRQEKNVWYEPECRMSDLVVEKDCIYRCCLNCGRIESVWVSDDFKGFRGCAGVKHKAGVMSLNARTTDVSDNGMELQGAHGEVTVYNAVEPTCTEPGMVGYTDCAVCNALINAGQTIEPLGHDLRTYPAQPATAFNPGMTQGVICMNCGEWIVERREIAQLDQSVLRLPAAIREIGVEAFIGAAVESVYLPDGCTRIEARAFADCPSLSSIRIPDSVNFIADDAFRGYANLVIICSEGSVAAGYAEDNHMQWIAE